MFLKKLELFGFKSFAERTELSFEPGVTAIVGPNGCGKSNVSDALKWVLGENSPKAVRGTRMEDVIFNGTVNRPPLNFAEVTLTFSNHTKIFPVEYDEVALTRRIFRTGESEYYLNKTKVRLKDILDLLMDTGLGTPSYSIIEQGKIDRILSSKPEDRRSVFEEASGIMKYKVKKTEAINKLKLTEENLLRVEDIIVELKRQLDSVERQARKARKYKELYGELKDLEIKNAQYLCEEYQAEGDSLLLEEKTIQEQIGTFDDRMKLLEEMFTEQQNVLGGVDQDIAHIQAELLKITHLISHHTHLIKVNEERIQEQTQRIQLIQEEISILQQKIRNLVALIVATIQEMESIQEAKKTKTALLVNHDEGILHVQNHLGELQMQVVQKKQEVMDASLALGNLHNGKVQAETASALNEQQIKKLADEKAAVLVQWEELNAKCQESIDKIQRIPQELEVLRQQYTHEKDKLSHAEQQKGQVNTALIEVRETMSAKRTQLEFIQGLIQTHEGYSTGIKNLLKAKEEGKVDFSSIKGILAEVVEVEESFIKAIEAAFGNNQETILVESSQEARRILAYMSAEKLGRIRMASVDMLQTSPSLRCTHPLVLGSAIDFVKCKEDLFPAVSAFLESKVIVKTIEDAYSVLADIPEVSCAVTLAGEEVYRNGLTIGGAAGATDTLSLLGRQTKIKILQEEIAGYVSKMNELEQNNREIDATIVVNKDAIRHLEITIQEMEFHLRSEYIMKEEFGRRIEESSNILTAFEKRSAALESERIHYQGMYAHIQDDILKKTACKEALVQALVDMENALERVAAEREALLMERTKLKAELSSLDSVTLDKQAFIERSEQEQRQAEESLVHKQKELNECSQKIQMLQEDILHILQQNDILVQQKEEYESQFVDQGNQRAACALKAVEIQEQIKSVIAEKQAVIARIADIQRRLTELQYQQKMLQDRMMDLYQVNIQTLALVEKETIQKEEIKKRIESLKDAVSDLGPVNLVAIEEEDQSKERYQFLSGQKEDLLRAREDLLKAIQKVNKTSRDLFLENFEKIKVVFIEYFKILFNGGEANLFLTEGQDVLESGIEIFVRPPGKKLQSISLLSGGERALTASALLFAIFKVKPSPFCILDEIDAPLDESNIDRFTKMLKEFIKSSQFIIITHNKKTISVADVLYGITMEELGISKIISVKFNKVKPTPIEHTVAS